MGNHTTTVPAAVPGKLSGDATRYLIHVLRRGLEVAESLDSTGTVATEQAHHARAICAANGIDYNLILARNIVTVERSGGLLVTKRYPDGGVDAHFAVDLHDPADVAIMVLHFQAEKPDAPILFDNGFNAPTVVTAGSVVTQYTPKGV